MHNRKLVLLGLLTAMGFLLMFFIEFPLPFLPPYLKYDPGEIPAIVAAGLFGPAAGAWVLVGKNLLFFLSGKAADGLLGVSASLVAGIGLTLGSITVYRLLPRFKLFGGIVGGILGITVLMSVSNYFIFLPLYGIPAEQLWPLTVGAVIPFNMVKGIISSTVGLILYEKVLVRISWFTRIPGVSRLSRQCQS